MTSKFVPVLSSQLRGRAPRRSKVLSLTDPAGGTVAEIAFGRGVKPALAIFETDDGRWRFLSGSRSEVAVLDPDGRTVARARDGEVLMPDGETLAWVRTAFVNRYHLGPDLWVAHSQLLRRGFIAKLSPEMLARDDRGMLTGLAATLTHFAVSGRSGGFDGGWFDGGGIA
jgi:hypothetical protein